MKNILILVIFLLFSTGVFGEDVTVNVMEGDSVTLHTGTNIQIDDLITWSFGQDAIAEVNSGSSMISVSVNLDQRFRDRLQLDNQTADLKISNIRNTDSGEYKLVIDRTIQISETFRLNVMPPGVSMMLVLEGQSVTLPTGLPEVQREDVVSWTFKDEKTLIAKMHKAAGIFSKYDGPDRMFVDKLELDYLAGSLTIRNAGNRHSGLYEVDLSSSKHTIHRSFSVTFSGEKRTVSEMKGESLTLHTGITEIESYDFTSWRFGDTVIAEIYQFQPSQPPNFFKYNGPDGRFRDRLNLDKTGSLTIMNTRITDSGEYELKIMKSRQTIFKRFTVTVSDSARSLCEKILIWLVVLLVVAAAAAAAAMYYRIRKSELERQKNIPTPLYVIENDSFTLNPDIEIQSNYSIFWIRDSVIASIRQYLDSGKKFVDERFKGRLTLDEKSGSLTINNATNTDSGLYHLQIEKFQNISLKRFFVVVRADSPEYKRIHVNEGETVTLNSGIDPTQIKKYEIIEWTCGPNGTVIPLKKPWFEYVANKEFRGRLKLDKKTRSLSITNIRKKDAGVYSLKHMINNTGTLLLYRVIVSDAAAPGGNDHESIPLNSVAACSDRL